jgi:hypothetical protein
MAAKDLLVRILDAGGFRLVRLGKPAAPGDATLTDNETLPKEVAPVGAPGQSLLAAAADHIHPAVVSFRIAASGTTEIPPNKAVPLAELVREPGELVLPNGLVFPETDLNIAVGGGLDVPGGPFVAVIATWHQRSGNGNHLSFLAFNRSLAPVSITWASVAVRLSPST